MVINSASQDSCIHSLKGDLKKTVSKYLLKVKAILLTGIVFF